MNEQGGEVSELDLDDTAEVFARELVEDDHVVDAVQELGAERLVELGFDLLVELFARALVVEDAMAADVGRHDDDGVGEVRDATARVGETPVVEDLEQDVEDVRMRLLHLVEEHDAVRSATHRLGQVAALVAVDVAGRRRRADVRPCASP